jgi:hypothetical protein
VDHSRKEVLRKEAALMLVLLFFGLALLPVAIFLVGQNVFGHYGGYGYGHFFGELIATRRVFPGPLSLPDLAAGTADRFRLALFQQPVRIIAARVSRRNRKM